MGLFKKKKKEGLPLPPPPPRVVERPPSDFEPIRPAAPEFVPPSVEQPELPPLPEFPEFEAPEPRFVAPPVREEEVMEPPRRVMPAKSFVAVEDYRRIMQESGLVRERLMEAEGLIKQLNDIKEHEGRLFERWRSHVEQIEKKLSHVDQVLSSAQG